MKKIQLSRHVDLGDDGFFRAGEHTVSAAIAAKIDKDERAQMRVIEDLKPQESKEVIQAQKAKTANNNQEK